MTGGPVPKSRGEGESNQESTSVAAAETLWSRFTPHCARSSFTPSSTAPSRRPWPSSTGGGGARLEEGELEFRISGEFIFLTRRAATDLSNYATFGHILTLCNCRDRCDSRWTAGTAKDWTLLLSLLGGETKTSPAERFKEILSRLKDAKIEVFQIDAQPRPRPTANSTKRPRPRPTGPTRSR